MFNKKILAYIVFVVIMIILSGCLWNPDLPLPQGISWVDPGNGRAYGALSWSPDSTKIAFTRYEAYTHPFGRKYESGEIYVLNSASGETVQLTHNKFEDSNPAWSPDGRQLIYARTEVSVLPQDFTRVYTYSLHVINLDGTNDQQIYLCPLSCGTPSWSPDGKHIAFYLSSSDARDPNDVDGPPYHLYTINLDGTGLTQLTKQAGHPLYPKWSPDGKSVLFEDWRRDWIQIIDIQSQNVITLTTPNLKYATDPNWALDQSKIIFVGTDLDPDKGFSHLYIFELSTKTIDPIFGVNGKFPEFPSEPALSSDGKYLAFIEADVRMYLVDLSIIKK